MSIPSELARITRSRRPGRGRGARIGRPVWFPALLGVSIAIALAFLVFPVLAIFAQVTPGRLLASLADPAATDALKLSLETTTIAVAIILLVGTPAAYLLATRSFPGRSIVVTLVELPLVLPPSVAGIGLLVAFGPAGLLGGVLHSAHIALVLQTAGVVVALIFVSAPFYLRQAQTAFIAVDNTWLEASRTLGADEARTFARIAVPAARAGLLAGLALAWGRALGEFGATLIFAGSFRGITQTAPLAIYNGFSVDLRGALALSGVLVIVSAALLLTVRLATEGGALRGAAG